MKKLLGVLLALTITSPIAAHADVDLDAQLHSMVTQKVMLDHQSDVRAGRISTRPQSKKASSNSSTLNSGTLTIASSSSTSAIHPSQIQELKVAKKVATLPAPVKKK